MTTRVALLSLGLILSIRAQATESITLGKLQFELKKGWRIFQKTKLEDSFYLGLHQGKDEIHIYLGNPNDPTTPIQGNGVETLNAVETRVLGGRQVTWSLVARQVAEAGIETRVYTASSVFEVSGLSYTLFSQSEDAVHAEDHLKDLMESLRPFRSSAVGSLSITDSTYSGRKFYFGWGAAGPGDPSNMHNEVKYDVWHTHDIFTKQIGGKYEGTLMTGASVTAGLVRQKWNQIKSLMSPNDMYIQYSSGHGNEEMLGIGLDYSEIRDNALSYPAKEIIMFTMACNSGGLVNSFNQKKSTWQNWQSQGRTLMVFASSLQSESSSTGPGTDPEEIGGPNGSAGSAYGHSLWKALIGYADGYVNGVKDGYLSLDEIIKYTKERTYQMGAHTPVATGAYQGGLIMARVPPQAWVQSLEHTTEGMSDREIQEQLSHLR